MTAETCNCLADFNEKLREHNTEIAGLLREIVQMIEIEMGREEDDPELDDEFAAQDWYRRASDLLTKIGGEP